MEERAILKNKVYLYLTEFFAGMAVMAVELGASRLLAPYFSSSQIVWTIIIGTIMIAMALGNMWGGKQADKNPNPDRLYLRLLVAAIWIAAIPFAGKYIILGISGLLIITVSQNLLVIAAFLSCMLIFVFPLFLLGTVTPSLVKYTVGSLDDSGKTVGALNACNTIGSILGTFLPTFITIPAAGTAATFLLFSGVLLLLSFFYFLSSGRRKRTCAVALVLFILCNIAGSRSSFAFWERNLVYEGESVYNYLQVRETENSVILSTNVLFGVQSIHMKKEGLTGMYYDYALAAPVLAGAEEKDKMDVLILGMGSGTYAVQCRKYFPQAQVEGVEIDQKITDLAREHFELPEDVEVATYDGRAYLKGVQKKYDVIMVDAYQDITIPFQMSSVEFFKEVQEHLKADGVMVVNMNMKSQKKGNINEYLSDTIASIFPNVYTVDVSGSSNRELFAFSDHSALSRLSQAGGLDRELLAHLENVEEGLMQYHGGPRILTDDQAPVELLGMRVIDELIQEELGYYKELFREKGIEGVLNGF
ncbi:MAG: fused MFS/spermidine synthase [Lachnospiraceae bacterium]|nr:fused MFS/spermidine synthase [Lachnospiraceae bacterium]